MFIMLVMLKYISDRWLKSKWTDPVLILFLKLIKTATKFLDCKICQVQEMHRCWKDLTLMDWGDFCAERIIQYCEIKLKHWRVTSITVQYA
jgi:hypothetical protein